MLVFSEIATRSWWDVPAFIGWGNFSLALCKETEAGHKFSIFHIHIFLPGETSGSKIPLGRGCVPIEQEEGDAIPSMALGERSWNCRGHETPGPALWM